MNGNFLNRALLRTHANPANEGTRLAISPPEATEGFLLSRRNFLKLTGLASGTISAGAFHRGRVTLTGNDRRVAALLDGVEKWVVDASWFGGQPKLEIEYIGAPGASFSLNNATFPGTDLPASFSCQLHYNDLFEITFARLNLKFLVSAVEWLAGLAPAASRWEGKHRFCDLGLGPAELCGESVLFFPDWRLLVEHPRQAFEFRGERLLAHAIQIALGQEEESLFARRPARRTFVTCARGDHGWDLIPPALKQRLGVQENGKSFSTLLIEYGEDETGLSAAAMAETLSGFQMRPGDELLQDDGSPAEFTSVRTRLAIYQEAGSSEGFLCGNIAPEQKWVHGPFFSAAVHGDLQEADITASMRNDESTVVEMVPCVDLLQLPVPGTEVCQTIVPREARLPMSWQRLTSLTPCARLRTSRFKSYPWFVENAAAGTILRLNGAKVEVVRPTDFLSLTLEFQNLQIELVNNEPILALDPNFRTTDFKDLAGLARKVLAKADSVSAFLERHATAEVRKALQACETAPNEQDKEVVIDFLNEVIRRDDLYDGGRFRNLRLSPDLRELIAARPWHQDGVRANRLLLDEVYPGEILARESFLVAHLPPQIIGEEAFYEDDASTPPPAKRPEFRSGGASRLGFKLFQRTGLAHAEIRNFDRLARVLKQRSEEGPRQFAARFTKPTEQLLGEYPDLKKADEAALRRRLVAELNQILRTDDEEFWKKVLGDRRVRKETLEVYKGAKNGIEFRKAYRRLLSDVFPGCFADGLFQRMPFNLDNLLDWNGFAASVAPNASFDAKDKPAVALPGPVDPFSNPNWTAIEIPFRLQLSPGPRAQWNQTPPPTSTLTSSELWKAQLVDPAVRAIFARDYDSANWPHAPTVGPGVPGSLSVHDRFQIVTLSSDYRANPSPPALGVSNLMVSSLGGWLQTHTEWKNQPRVNGAELDLCKWEHIATMGREHYVRVEYEGFLFPVGHRAVLVKETVRRFFQRDGDPRKPNVCLLRQSCFVVIKQPTRLYPGSIQINDTKVELERNHSNDFPFGEITFLTLQTPPLDDLTRVPAAVSWAHGRYERDPATPQERSCDSFDYFWPVVRGKRFRFEISIIDKGVERAMFRWPFIFIRKNPATDPGVIGTLIDSYNALPDVEQLHASGRAYEEDAYLRLANGGGQKVHFAAPVNTGDTALETRFVSLRAQTVNLDVTKPEVRELLQSNRLPIFGPAMSQAQVNIPSVEMLNPKNGPPIIRYNDIFRQVGFADAGLGPAAGAPQNIGEVFADLVQDRGMQFPPDKGGGLTVPNVSIEALSRNLGPVGGRAATLCNGTFNPLDFFNKLDAKLLGVISLKDILMQIDGLGEQLDRIPKMLAEQRDGMIGQANERLQGLLKKINAVRNAVLVELVKARDAVQNFSNAITLQARGELAKVHEQLAGMAEFLQILSELTGVNLKPPVVRALAGGIDCNERLPSAAEVEEELKKLGTVTQATIDEVKNALSFTTELVVDTATQAKGSVAALLEDLRAQYRSVTDFLRSLYPEGLLLALENLIARLKDPSIDALLEAPGDIRVLMNEAENFRRRIGAFDPKVAIGAFLASIDSFLGQLQQNAGNFQSAFLAVAKAARDNAQIKLQNVPKELFDRWLGKLNAVVDCVRSLIWDEAAPVINPARLYKAIDDLRTKLRGVQQELKEKLDDLLITVLPVVQRVEEVRRLLAEPVELALDYTFSPLMKDGPSGSPIFKASLNGTSATMDISVHLSQKLNLAGMSAERPSTRVQIELRNFQLVLLPSATFLIVKVKGVSFKAENGAKPNVDVSLAGIELGDCLEFVKTLQSAIPALGNKGNGPFLDIDALQIRAGYRFASGVISLGALNCYNLAIEASVALSLAGDPLRVRFSFCRRERPFLLAAGVWGGGGFLAVDLMPGRADVEGSLEWGAMIGFTAGPASGFASITAGIYFKTHSRGVVLTGFFRADGEMDIAGIISLSMLFYLGLSYVSIDGQSYAEGEVIVHVEIEIGFFSIGYDLHAKRRLAGGSSSGGSAGNEVRALGIVGKAASEKRKKELARRISANATRFDQSTLDSLDPSIWKTYQEAFA